METDLVKKNGIALLDTSLHKTIVTGLLVTAVFGYVLGYQKLYAFHLFMCTYWVFLFLGFIKIRKVAVKSIALPLFFLLMMVVSLLWTPNIKNGLYFIFYFLCGYTLIFSIVNYSSDINRLNYIFKILGLFFLLNFFVGLLETSGYFRLPVSPYYGESHTRPSGFNSNLNNFGFVFVAIFPFLFLYPKRGIKLLSITLALWFVYKLESKGFFLGLFVFFIICFLVDVKKKSAWQGLAAIALSAGMLVLVSIVALDQVNFNNRAFSAFNQIERAVNLAKSGDVKAEDSTSVRTAMYLYGVKELFASHGLGLGTAGVGSQLASETSLFGEDKDIFSFHNFFLEMLVDIGIIPFFIIMLAYLKLAFALIKQSRCNIDKNLSYMAKASALSLLVIIPASIAPSSIIYVFTFWMVIGFSMATFLIIKENRYV